MDGQRNPNYPPSFPSFSQSPSSRIAPQQPSYDPFQRSDQRRDPFMPPSLANRRGSQNGNGRMPSNLDAVQPKSQHPPSPLRPSSQPLIPHERRNSPEGRYNPGQSIEHGSVSQPSQQPSSTLLARHIPPSPKESSSPSHGPNSMRAPLPPSSSSRPKDPPQRSSSMSIQAIIGSDAAPTNNQASRSSTAGSYSAHDYPNPTSSLDHKYNGKRDADAEPAPHTPIRRPDGPAYVPYDRPVTTLPSPIFTSIKDYQPSDRDSQGFSRLLQPLHHTTELRSSAPPLSYSQPAGDDNNSIRAGPLNHDRRSLHEYYGGTFENAIRDRSHSGRDHDQNRETSIDHIPRPPVEPFTPVSGAPNPLNTASESRYVDHRGPQPNENGPIQPGDRASSIPGQYSTLNGMAEPASEGRDIQSHLEQRFSDDTRARTPIADAQMRKSIDESNRQSFSRFAHELARRPDRSSPLPQAVQGAQSQPAGSARDPGVKSEFGRMFSGLGNGLRNTPQPVVSQSNGAGTPRRSPDEGLADTDRPPRRGGTGTRATGPGSRGGRRGKRALVEESRLESDEGDGRTTPVAPARGTKRGRYLSHSASHHHHHHPQGTHHHHHHHPRKVDDAPIFPLNRQPSSGPSNSLKFAPTSGTPGVPHHHHHHPHPNGVPRHHHHHLHASAPDARIKRPVVTISTSPLLHSVAHLPRNHLGSQIYDPTIAVAPAASSTIDSPLSHQSLSKPNPLPRFQISQANSTFTIRIPRYYLSNTERERICKSRYLWGTDVYTDDSDPLAAAFHSGWIRGAWPANVDISMLVDLWSPESTVTKAKDAKIDQGNTDTLTTPPSNGPLLPPPNKDLHLTILILPPLEKYAGLARYGIKSRTWGDNHDGLSFKIDKIEWVDEGQGSRWEERGALARSKRIAHAIAHSKFDDNSSRQTIRQGTTSQDDRGLSQRLRNPLRNKALAIPAA